MYKLKVFLIVFFLIVQNTYAVEIGSESIHSKSYSVQVGAFKNMSNIQKIKEKLFEYEIYLEPYKNLHRVHVVNIITPVLKETLTKIRKIYPKAFISKRPISNSIPMKTKQKIFDKINKSFKPSGNIIEEIKQYEPSLDSNTILKTRKSFL